MTNTSFPNGGHYRGVPLYYNRSSLVCYKSVTTVAHLLPHMYSIVPSHLLFAVVKQRLQMYHTPYRGALDCIRTVYMTEGARAFYRSYTTQLSMNIPFQVVHFVSYESFQDIFNNSRQYNPLSHMLSGAGAGALAAAITTPLDVAKTLLNTHEQRHSISKEQRIRGMLSALVKIYQVKGVSGYFRGITARVVYQVPSTAICWSVYEFFKHSLGLKQQQNHTPIPEDPPSQI